MQNWKEVTVFKNHSKSLISQYCQWNFLCDFQNLWKKLTWLKVKLGRSGPMSLVGISSILVWIDDEIKLLTESSSALLPSESSKCIGILLRNTDFCTCEADKVGSVFFRGPRNSSADSERVISELGEWCPEPRESLPPDPTEELSCSSWWWCWCSKWCWWIILGLGRLGFMLVEDFLPKMKQNFRWKISSKWNVLTTLHKFL